MSILNKIASQLRVLITGSTATDQYDICPVCLKSDEVIPIRYGKPNTALMEQANKGKVRLGGCMSADRPSRYCKRDDMEF